MDLTGLGSVASFASKVVDKISAYFPDPAQKAAALLEIRKLEQTGELAQLAADTDLMKGQLEINKVEAASSSKFISYWRPAVGWIGVISLAMIYWPKAIALCAFWCVQTYHLQVGAPLPPYPDLGLTDILGLLAPLLGIGGMRTAEKITGTEGNR